MLYYYFKELIHLWFGPHYAILITVTQSKPIDRFTVIM